ncbi:MAG: regulatory protein RecX [Pseudomonadota bacterium]
MNDKIFNQGLDLAYRYLSYKPRSIQEMAIYLKKKDVEKNLIATIIKYLIDQKFLDDHEFTKWFIENRTTFKPKSTFAMGYELKIKGIPTSISEPILSKYDDMSLALKAIAPKLKRWRSLDKDGFKKKALNFLRYRGFSYNVCMVVLDCLQQEENK